MRFDLISLIAKTYHRVLHHILLTLAQRGHLRLGEKSIGAEDRIPSPRDTSRSSRESSRACMASTTRSMGEAWAKHGENRWNGTTKHETQFSIRKPHHADLLVQKSPAEAAPRRLNKAFSMFQLKCRDIPIQYSNNQKTIECIKNIHIRCVLWIQLWGYYFPGPFGLCELPRFFGKQSPMRLALKQHLAKA